MTEAILPISEDEKALRGTHKASATVTRVMDGAPVCADCDEVYPCTTIRTIDGLRAEIDAVLEACRLTFGFRNMVAIAGQAHKTVHP